MVKFTFVQALRLCTGRTAHGGSRGIALPFHDHGTIRGWVVSVTSRPLFTPVKSRYPLYRRLGGPEGRFGKVRKILPPPGFDPRTVQPVASRYTDWATHSSSYNNRTNISSRINIFWGGSLKEEHHLKDLDLDGRIIFTDLKEIGWSVDWIDMTKDRDRRLAGLNNGGEN